MDELYYSDYLELDSLLGSQSPKSFTTKNPIPDEMLFIITHQTYELWFKQILQEVDAVVDLFNQDNVHEVALNMATKKIGRINKIIEVTTSQIPILETMDPATFVEFRDYLSSASGLQSYQFRLIEMKLGLQRKKGSANSWDHMIKLYRPDHQKLLKETMKQKGLALHVSDWLGRVPFLDYKDFHFWDEYSQSVKKMLQEDELKLKKTLADHPEELAQELKMHQITQEHFNALLDAKKFQEQLASGQRTFSQKAILGALFITLYRHEPLLDGPYRFLSSLMELEELLVRWRQTHAMMANRMLGNKLGTGGSSGHHYLQNTVSKNRIFMDLFHISSYLMPQKNIPVLPSELKQELGFYFQGKQ